MDGNGDDPFDSLTKLCIVSDSQEDILRHCSFAGGPKSVRASGFSPSQILHLQTADVAMASPPESLEQREQITSRDAYQAPPEQSGGQQAIDVDDSSLKDTAAAVEGGCVRDVATGVDLGKNNDLGFRSEVQSTDQTAEIEIIGVRRSKVSEAESSSKRLKLSNEALGTNSSVPIIVEKLHVDLESESVPVEEESGKVDDGKISNGKETHCNKNKEKLTEKKVENSQPEEPSGFLGALNPKRKPDADASATPSGDSEAPSIIMKILKVLTEEESEEDKKYENMDIIEIAMSRGMTFPRPCWWPEGEDFGFKKNNGK